MPLSFPESAQLAPFVGRSPWTAADALVGSLGFDEAFSLQKSGSRGTRADQGVCPTTASESPGSGKLSGVGMSSCGGLPTRSSRRLTIGAKVVNLPHA
jgi:hypothetical protein